MGDFGIEPLAEDALLIRFGEGIDAHLNARVHAATHALRTAALPGITDIAPAYASVLVRIDADAWLAAPPLPPFERISARLRATIGGESPGASLSLEPVGGAAAFVSPGNPRCPDPIGRDGRGERDAPSRRAKSGSENPRSTAGAFPPHRTLQQEIKTIPVCYAAAFAPDLSDVAAHAGLTVDQVISRHTAAEYTVAMLGFAPGFPYLLGLDDALQTPRRASPRTRVPAGAVGIGGAQAGIYPRELPGGWNLIGRTPVVLFDPCREPPCLLLPGDRVRFHAIDAVAFARLAGTSA